jgi:hypothetical protein
VIIVINADKVTQLKVACSTSRLASNAFHGTPIAKYTVGVVVDKVVTGLVEYGSRMCLRHRQSDGIAETLAQGTSSDFDTRSIVRFRVSGSDTVDLLPELKMVRSSVNNSAWREK